MATLPASTGAPPRAPTEPPKSTAKAIDLATEIQTRMHQLVALSSAIYEALEIPTPDELTRESVGRVQAFSELQQEIGTKVLDLAQQIERLALRGEA